MARPELPARDARGFLLVAIVFILFTALARDQPEWVRNARSYPILQQTQVAIESLLPMNPEQYLPQDWSAAQYAGARAQASQMAHPRRPQRELPLRLTSARES